MIEWIYISIGPRIMDRKISVALLALGALAAVTSTLAADERWKCVLTIEVPTIGRELHVSRQFTISNTEVTSLTMSRSPSAPTIHYKIIENSDDGLKAVTNSSYQGFSGTTHDAEVITLDKHSGVIVEATVSLSDKSPPIAWQNKRECHKN
jgi:hypothetical protein